MMLCKSYRSTYEIANFAQKIRMNKDMETIVRHGEQPCIIQCENREGELQAIADLIADFRKGGNKSLGIICKTEQQAKEMSVCMRDNKEEIYFLSNSSPAFVNGIIFTSAHLAKGLEFDEVIISQINDENYYSEIDRSMLYVAVTRAMHKLTLTYHGRLSNFIL